MPEQRQSPKYVVICEKKSDAPSAIKNIKDGTIKFFSTSPEVCYELDKVDIKYTDMETIYPGNLEDTDEMYDKVMKMCTEIDTDNEFNAMRDNYYFIKRLYDALYLRTVALKKIIDKEKPDKIIVFVDDVDAPMFDSMHPFGESDSIFALLLQTGKFKCEYEIYKRPKNKQRIAVTRGTKKREIPQGVYNILFCIKHRGLGAGLRTILYTAKNKIAGKKTLLAMSRYNYSWQYIIPELTKAGFNLVIPDMNEFMAPYTGEPTRNLDKAIRYCVAGGIDFSEPFMTVLRKKVAIYDKVKSQIYHATRLAIKAYKPYAVIGSTKPTFNENLVAKAASDHWIPVVTWQHGAAYPPNYGRMIPFTEMMNSDIHLSFGEGYDAFTRKFGCIIIPVGSYDLNKIFFSTGRRKKEFDILYVTTLYTGNQLYSSTSTDNKLWRAQRTILDMLSKQQHLRVAIKLHPKSTEEHVIYKYLGIKNIEIFKNERTYHDLMRHAKIVIVDYPSTTMLEAMASGKEVFVLTDQVTLTEEEKTLLKKRVFVFDTPESLLSTLERYLRGEIIDNAPDKSNNEFLIKYGIHAPDGNVATRVIAALKTITGPVTIRKAAGHTITNPGTPEEIWSDDGRPALLTAYEEPEMEKTPLIKRMKKIIGDKGHQP